MKINGESNLLDWWLCERTTQLNSADDVRMFECAVLNRSAKL